MFEACLKWCCDRFKSFLIKFKYITQNGTCIKSCRWMFYVVTLFWIAAFFAYHMIFGEYIVFWPFIWFPVSCFLYIETAYYSAKDITVNATLLTKYVETEHYYRRGRRYDVTETPTFVFKTDSGEEIKLRCTRVEYEMYRPYDKGVLSYKKYRFQKFLTGFVIT